MREGQKERRREGENERRRDGKTEPEIEKQKRSETKRDRHTPPPPPGRAPADPLLWPGGVPLDGAKKAKGSKDDLKGALGSFLKVNDGVNTVRAHPWCLTLSSLAFTIVNRVCMALLYGCTGSLTYAA